MILKKGDKFVETFEITPEIHAGFIAVFRDRHPLHTSREYAIAKGFKSEVMHGNILNGFLSYFIGEVVPDREMMILAQEIKFARPVYLGDRLTLHAEVAEVHESVGMVEFKFKFVNGDGVNVASAKLQGVRALARS